MYIYICIYIYIHITKSIYSIYIYIYIYIYRRRLRRVPPAPFFYAWPPVEVFGESSKLEAKILKKCHQKALKIDPES